MTHSPEVRQVVVELRYSSDLAAAAADARDNRRERPRGKALLPMLPGVRYDEAYGPIFVPAVKARGQSDNLYDIGPLHEVDHTPEHGSFIVRGEVNEADYAAFEKAAVGSSQVVRVYPDLPTAPFGNCPGKAVGKASDVERMLGVQRMRTCGMDGRNAYVAVVDGGISLRFLELRGRTPALDRSLSWSANQIKPGNGGGSQHGTMCAWDICIAAPQCTLLDIIVFGDDKPTQKGLLSDSAHAYDHLIGVRKRQLAQVVFPPALVVNNSWGIVNRLEDPPEGTEGNYSNNPNHWFIRKVVELEDLGADILFAAGNCGPECPDKDCLDVTNDRIYGANSHPSVLCVAAVDINQERLGYSNIGPGQSKLMRMKPDIAAYSHFLGSKVEGVLEAFEPPDTGTSAACAVASGVLAALRSVRPYSSLHPSTWPAAIRSLVLSSAQHPGRVGYDFGIGHGVISGGLLARKVCPDIARSGLSDLCDRMPWLCETTREEPFPGFDFPDPRRFFTSLRRKDMVSLLQWFEKESADHASPEMEAWDEERIGALLSYYAGYRAARQQSALRGTPGKCGCGS